MDLVNSINFLCFDNNFNQPLNQLPPKLKVLQLGNKFNQLINHLPSLEKLILGDKFNQLIDYLPLCLKELTLENNFNQ